ncbi:flagellar protein FlgN [Roseobacter sinensis]|uniref:Flagellar protein FlgN n=1 Tax=Roseobacter sinensis TaxID=2931391 RepID=A0ABT3B8K7_9RHOB|nr:flagellar protein FlgN [Roseobacter sp. WL0113]MCV3269901.1 flagellar protein FlgN [Roseobacter sp. WL0113]
MTNEEFEDVVDALDDLLEAERAALLAGDLDEVGRLLERKEGLIERFATLDDADRDALAGLQTKLKRNQALLDQALEGIRSVSRRLAALRRVRSSLETYDDKGERRSIDIALDGSVEKRA